MSSVSDFVRNHPLLCASTLGVAILGHLGFRAVCWMSSGCQKTDEVAKKINVEVKSGKITMGQGEYIVFHQLQNGKKKHLSSEMYEQVYKILTQYSPVSLMNSGSERVMEECDKRYEIIKEKIKKIDPTLEAVFIPRTLYELVYIRECISEDLKHESICPLVDPKLHDECARKYVNVTYLEQVTLDTVKRSCWHTGYFKEYKDVKDNYDEKVINIAYRLNGVMLETLAPPREGFTFQKLSHLTETMISFLKIHHKNKLVKEIYDCDSPGPTVNFCVEIVRGSVRPMGIRDEKDAQIIRNAMLLDCSEVAKRSFLLYRGGDLKEDSIFSLNDENKPYSLSYGTSLFAGCLYDGSATAFHFMRNMKNGYAIAVPFDQIDDSPFYIPPVNTVAQLFGHGETFHSRSKGWKGCDLMTMGGFHGPVNTDKRQHLVSSLGKEELINDFQSYKDSSILFS